MVGSLDVLCFQEGFQYLGKLMSWACSVHLAPASEFSPNFVICVSDYLIYHSDICVYLKIYIKISVVYWLCCVNALFS